MLETLCMCVCVCVCEKQVSEYAAIQREEEQVKQFIVEGDTERPTVKPRLTAKLDK